MSAKAPDQATRAANAAKAARAAQQAAQKAQAAKAALASKAASQAENAAKAAAAAKDQQVTQAAEVAKATQAAMQAELARRKEEGERKIAPRALSSMQQRMAAGGGRTQATVATKLSLPNKQQPALTPEQAQELKAAAQKRQAQAIAEQQRISTSKLEEQKSAATIMRQRIMEKRAEQLSAEAERRKAAQAIENDRRKYEEEVIQKQRVEMALQQRRVAPLEWVNTVSRNFACSMSDERLPAHCVSQRFPQLSTLQSLDLVAVRLHNVSADFSSLPSTLPITVQATEEKQEKVVQPGTSSHSVRVMLFSNQENIPEACHPLRRLHLLMLQADQVLPTCPGGFWVKELDGKNPDSLDTLKKTAVRHVKAQTGADLSSCTFHRFMEFIYRKDGEMSQTTILVPEIWKAADLPLKMHIKTEQVEVEVSESTVVEEPLSPEELEERQKKLELACEAERAEAMKVREGERESERLERIAKLEEQLTTLGTHVVKTRPVVKVTKSTKEETKIASRPVVRSIADFFTTVMGADRESCVTYFEAALFCHFFDEVLRCTFGADILKWAQDFLPKKAIQDEERNTKRKREQEEVLEFQQNNAELISKRARTEQSIFNLKREKEFGEGRLPTLREIDRLEQEQILAENTMKLDELDQVLETFPLPMRPPPKTTTVYELEKSQAAPFRYFDTSPNAPSGKVSAGEIEKVLWRSGISNYREMGPLGPMLQSQVRGAPSTPGFFHYEMACSMAKNVPVVAEAE